MKRTAPGMAAVVLVAALAMALHLAPVQSQEKEDRTLLRWDEMRAIINEASGERAMHHVLELVPYMLSVSPLDCEALDLLFGFDFTYRGNHNELVAEALGLSVALEHWHEVPGATVINYEPSVTLALDEECRLQCRLSIETRTSAYQVRTGEYPEEQLSVYVTARQYGSLTADTRFGAALDALAQVCHEMTDRHVVEQVLRPLARTIAMK